MDDITPAGCIAAGFLVLLAAANLAWFTNLVITTILEHVP